MVTHDKSTCYVDRHDNPADSFLDGLECAAWKISTALARMGDGRETCKNRKGRRRMSNVLMWMLQAVGILAMALIAIILLVFVGGLVFAICYGIHEGWKDGDGDG